MATTSPAACVCRSVEEHAQDPSIPVEVGAEGRFRIVFSTPEGEGYVALHYCYICGGRLPRAEPPGASVEMRRLKAEIGMLGSLEEARRKLGEPDDEVVAPSGSGHGRAFVYRRLSDLFDVFVFMAPSGEIVSSFSPKSR